MSRYGVWVVCLAALWLWASAASAQELRSYEAPSPQDQLELDVTAVPDGKGAIFVPSLTDASLEPAIIVKIDGERVALGRTGERLVVPPGEYEVRAGTGPSEKRARTTVQVEAGETTEVAPFFTAVRVQAVDRAGAPQRVTYTVSQEGQEFGSWETSGEGRFADSAVLFVPAGTFMLGLGTSEDTNASAVAVPARAGDLLNYRLVVDRERLFRAELATEDVEHEPSIWRYRWTVGVDGTLEETSNRLRGYSGRSLRIGVFTEASVGIDTGNHVAQLNMELDESWIGFESDYGPELPFQKLSDEATAELLYNYRLGGIIGPYMRGMATTSFFPTELEFGADSEVVQQETGQSETVERGDTLRLAEPFSPTFLQQGGGVSVNTLERQRVNLLVRGGVAARQSFFRDARYVVESDGDRLSVIDLEDNRDLGAEMTALARFRPSNAVRLDAGLEVFLPQDQVLGDEDLRPIYRLSGLLDMRITNYASFIYRFSLARDDVQIDGPQSFHSMALRLQHSFF